MRQSQSFRLHLADDRGRENKQPPELVLNVLPNRPPELKLTFPSRDVDVSPLEELSVKAQVWDDFGVKRVGVSYGIAGKDTKDVVLAEGVKGKEKRDVAELLPLEKLEAQPDEAFDVNQVTVPDLSGRPQYLVDRGYQPLREVI